MSGDILTLLGGTGMFLLGMRMMTGALGELASRQTRAVLRRVTTSPLTGAVAGAATTALIQSSSATLVMTIGFVGAGLLSFPQAMGVVFGANVGTTITGWMVVLLGFKLDLARLALPLLFAAGLLLALGRGSWGRVGGLLAGFSLVFLGLDMMQAGAEGFRDGLLTFAPTAETLWGRLRLLLLGVAVTVVIQSSSAGVAATLVLLGTGGLSLPQAAAMVVGMDIGTTFKSVVATVGGSRDMRRTAIAHVVYNVITGIAAFAVVATAAPALARAFGGDEPAALVAFHTLFNVLGVVLVLPFTRPFARLIEWLVPGSGAVLAEPPDRRLLADAPAALDAARGASDADATALFAALGARLAPGGTNEALVELVPLMQPALEDLGAFVTRIAVPDGQAAPLARRTALLHRIDHINRLWHRAGAEDRLALLTGDPVLRRPATVLGTALRHAAAAPSAEGQHRRMNRIARLIGVRAGRLRRAALLREHVGLVSPRDVFDQTDAIRSLERMAQHAERILHYGEIAAMDAPPAQALLSEDVENARA
ncbi:MAG: Na/Pi cotransporter family protein [Rhodobacteraceae bacterium]|jgi:phosphate:Na+ symporter|uniref:Na/Pi cotransporter family protein n=1 Tax=Albidovulum sp. TaxID=1872424 RepID=UPI001D686A15|nr:Na/Pi symporter [uncultured Defluviimonas sp.]MCB2125934.1 Na/Pi cotransporter family protein [Paracoccaceae bacterium]MCC0071428.1 Na/Pi cotransporter family protein [Paracoccaceae bacterium]